MARYSEAEITDIFHDALDYFNDHLDTDISRDNTLLAFFTPENGVEIYEKICSAHFPSHLRENYRAEGYMEGFLAQAFVGEGCYGIMIRSDLDEELPELFRVFLHEISHLFCTANEIEGGHFFDRYCMGSGEEDGKMNAGYAIWREFVADMMADSLISEYATISLSDAKREIEHLYSYVSPIEPDSKKCVSLILAYIMVSKEVSTVYEWERASVEIEKKLKLKSDALMQMLRLVFEKLHQQPFWEISPDFIYSLGELYLLVALQKFMSK